MKTSRNTVAKTAILDVLKNAEVALSHSEIQTLSDNICDRVTIYRILDRLVTDDLVHKIVNLDGTIKYATCHHKKDHAVHTHNHIHFSCLKCNLLTCLDNVEPTFILPTNYQIKEVNFTISGFCPSCS